MIIIVCMDKKNGMMFNERRQSQDQEVIKKMLEYAKGKPLWINDYSAQLFREEQQKQIRITENFFDFFFIITKIPCFFLHNFPPFYMTQMLFFSQKLCISMLNF